ncbi:MAG: HAMP domain-containing histidine kinase [Methylococcaceae bacterium]|nr:HAMP domain-containing histidine kinase [Methylococcaceae bacterium]
MDSTAEISKKRLGRWLFLFFMALAIPSGILIQQAYSQLKWQAFHQHRLIAEELAARIDSNLRRLIDQEESRSFTDYQFLVLEGEAYLNLPQRSPLSIFPVSTSFPGAIGYFQVDSLGSLSTPLLPRQPGNPSALGLPADEFQDRFALENRIRGILSRNKLVNNGKPDRLRDSEAPGRQVLLSPQPGKVELEKAESQDSPKTSAEDIQTLAPADSISPQAAFDQLNSLTRRNEVREKIQKTQKQGTIGDFNLDYSYQSGSANAPSAEQDNKKTASEPKRIARKERIAVAEPQAPSGRVDLESGPALQDEPRIHTFESEIDPFEFSLLDSGHFVLFRKVWRDRQRYIQGMLIEQQPFLNGIVSTAFDDSPLSKMSDLIIAYQGTVFSAFKRGVSLDYAPGTTEFAGSVLYQTRLSPPLNDFDLVFSVTRLPPGPGSELVFWIAIVLVGVLAGGFVLMYRTGVVQITMGQQQRNFVSAISHELKTPLTSIRMYSEMLREGWTSEEKKIAYYDYILSESERLTRLINNVMQLAKLGRGEVRMEIKAVPVGTLMEEVRQKVLTQTDAAGFQFVLSISSEAQGIEVKTDPDAFTQIIINLVDNAIKFSRKSDRRIIELGCGPAPAGSVRFSVRDYGPGIVPDQMKKIFKLFYRAENELTRETVGTGIGLALVRQLANRMQGRVDVINKSPGAEFTITLPAAS